ncbi:hypothetical protein LR48_Vigan2307s000100 [Vigna angularis]|nr:hypothetical protein LR48_Vigan2307s000100 [Vigna angularis]
MRAEPRETPHSTQHERPSSFTSERALTSNTGSPTPLSSTLIQSRLLSLDHHPPFQLHTAKHPASIFPPSQ